MEITENATSAPGANPYVTAKPTKKRLFPDWLSGKHRFVGLGILLLAVAAIPLTISLSQQQQDTRQHADVVASEPLYRLSRFLGGSVDHLYVATQAEATTAESQGFTMEGVEGNVFPTQVTGSVPIYRLVILYPNGNTDHIYTISSAERDNLINTFHYTFEQIEAYAFPTTIDGTAPVMRLVKTYGTPQGLASDHYYTMDAAQRDFAISQGYVLESANVWSMLLPNVTALPTGTGVPNPLPSTRPTGIPQPTAIGQPPPSRCPMSDGPCPLITSITPSTTSVGSTITINGTGFTDKNTILVNGSMSAGTPTSADGTTIQLTIPSTFIQGCGVPTYGPIIVGGCNTQEIGPPVAAGTYNITVLNHTGTGYNMSNQLDLHIVSTVPTTPPNTSTCVPVPPCVTGGACSQEIPPANACPNEDSATPVYRVAFSGTNGEYSHFYSIDDAYITSLVAQGWHDRTTFSYAFKTQLPGTIPLYVLYKTTSSGAGDFLYSVSSTDRSVAVNSFGYVDNNSISMYIFSSQVPRSVPVYRLTRTFPSGNLEHFMTGSEVEKNYAVNNLGYTVDGILGYWYPIPTISACVPLPACIDATPSCQPPEPAGGWCPSVTTGPIGLDLLLDGVGHAGDSTNPSNSSTSTQNPIFQLLPFLVDYYSPQDESTILAETVTLLGYDPTTGSYKGSVSDCTSNTPNPLPSPRPGGPTLGPNTPTPNPLPIGRPGGPTLAPGQPTPNPLPQPRAFLPFIGQAYAQSPAQTPVPVGQCSALIPNGSYVMKIKEASHLTRRVPNTVQIVSGQNMNLSQLTFIAGDANDDNTLDIGDWNVLLSSLSCSGGTDASGNACTSIGNADLNYDGVVDLTDINLFLRELSVQHGE